MHEEADGQVAALAEDDSDGEVDYGDIREEEAEPLPALMTQHDPRRMKLTPEELDWALDIKHVIENMPELDNLSDFMYAQLALICRDDAEDAVRRAFALQHFRQEYSILESYTDGCRRLQEYADLFPCLLMHFMFDPQAGTYVLVTDMTKFDSAAISSPKKLNILFAGCYYSFHTTCPDMESIRKGLVSLVECEGIDWTKKQDFKLLQKVYAELFAVYPFTAVARHYHTSMIFNVIATMLRSVLPKYLKNRLQTGFTCEERLDTLFFQPNPQEAIQRMLGQKQQALKLRLENERSFTLDAAV